MNRSNHRTEKYWLLALFVLNLGYLIYELAFNSRLVDVSVSNLANSEVMALELEGRVLSGIGLSLLLLRFIAISKHSLAKNAGLICLAIVVGFPAMFYGQKLLVEGLVERTTAEQRMDAQHLLLLKRGLATNALQIEGLELAESDLDSPHTKSFLSVLGLMTFVSAEFIEVLKEQTDAVILQVARNEANTVLPESYEQYRVLQRTIGDAWDEYEVAADEYWNALGELRPQAEEAWLDLQTELYSEWEVIAQASDPREVNRQVLTLQRNLQHYFSARDRCESIRYRDECLLALEDEYRKQVTENLGTYVSALEWCHEPRQERRTVQRNGRFVTETVEIQQCSDLRFEHLEQKLKAVLELPDSFEAFLQTRGVITATRQNLLERGIAVPIEWAPNDRETFINIVLAQGAQAVAEEAEARVEDTLGIAMPLDLDADGFLASPPVQDRLHEALNPVDPTMTIRLDMDPESFRDSIVAPHYVRHAEQERARLYSDAKDLGNGGAREEEGKRYVRALVVPAIAMGFSLFFALLNAVGLMASLPALIGIKAPWLSHGIKLLGMAAIVAVPMLNSAAIVHTPTYQYFEEQTQSALGPAGSLFSTWVINTEPAIYGIGASAARIAPPLFTADPELVEREREAMQPPEVDTRVDRRLRTGPQAESDPVDVADTTQPKESFQPIEVRYLSAFLPVGPQVTRAIESGADAILVDVQVLNGGQWVVHRSPLITGQGTCLTNYRGPVLISEIDRLQWRAARYGSCSTQGADRPVSIPSLDDFVRTIARSTGDHSLWVHFQPTIHGEAQCNAIREAADDISEQLGNELFVAAFSVEATLSCFDRHPRDYRIAYFAPEYGEPEERVQSRVGIVNLWREGQELRARARGKDYRAYAMALPTDLKRITSGRLGVQDWVVVDNRHWTAGAESILSQIDSRRAVLGQSENGDTINHDSTMSWVIRE